MYRRGRARTLPPQKDCIIDGKGEAVERDRSRCRHQDQSRPRIMSGQEGFPRRMSANRKVGQVIEGDAFDASVVKEEAAWLDQIDPDPKTGGETQEGTGILRYVRLNQGEAQTCSKARVTGCGSCIISGSSILGWPPNSAAVCRIVRFFQQYSFRRQAAPDETGAQVRGL
jgi:hypothetical protein